MAFANIDQLTLGNFLQIVFTKAVWNQLSADYRDFEMVQKMKENGTMAREVRFLFQDSYGPAATQFRNPGVSNQAYPTGFQSGIGEKSAKYKQVNTTIDLEYQLYDRILNSPQDVYVKNALEFEINSKAISSKRRLAAFWYLDGTGVLGQLPAASVALSSPASDQVIFTLESSNTARGHIGAFEFGDILILRASGGSASALDTNLGTEPIYWKVISKDRANNKVTLQGLSSTFASAGTISSITTQPTAGDVFYMYDQPTIPNLGAAISDYGTITEALAGLESLVADDGRVIHGITMSGASAGSRYDAGGDPLDVRHIQAAMDSAKVKVGQGMYSWNMMCMAPEAAAALIESRETDRRFNSVEDGSRGTRKFIYQHYNDAIEVYTSEYCPFKRIYIAPENRGTKQKVFQAWGGDFKAVEIDGKKIHLKPGASGNYVNNMVSFMECVAVWICSHPASTAVVHNYVLD